MAEHQPEIVETNVSPSETLVRGTKKALLIGVSQYASGWRSLPPANRDAEELKQLLQHPDIGAFDQVRLLLNPERQRLEEEIYVLAANCQPEDVILVYFSGHGIVDDADGKLFLATSITRKDDQGDLIKPTAVELSVVQQILDSSRSEQQVVILDCCFSHTVDAPSSDRPLNVNAQLGGSNRLVLTASSSTGYSCEQKQGAFSLYTSYLIEGIQTGTAQRSTDDVVTVKELHHYTQRKVQTAAPAIEPQLYAARPEFDIVLTKAPLVDAKLSYRQDVEDRSHGGENQVSEFDRLILNWRRDRLGLSPETTAEIEAAVLKPHQECQQKLQQYHQKLNRIISLQYPFSETTIKGLERFRQRLGLRQEQTDAIAVEVIAPYQQQYQQNLKRYEQHFAQEVKAEYPLNRNVRNELRYLEEQLKLRYEDIAAIHQRILARHQDLSASTAQSNGQAAVTTPAKNQFFRAPISKELPTSENSISPEQAAQDNSQITEGAISPEEYKLNLQRYQQFFLSKFQPNHPLDEQALYELTSLQHVLQLEEADVAQTEAEGAQQKLQDYGRNLQQYEQEFMRTAQLESLSNPFTQTHLKQLQQTLNLAPQDAELVEQVALELLEPDSKTAIEADSVSETPAITDATGSTVPAPHDRAVSPPAMLDVAPADASPDRSPSPTDPVTLPPDEPISAAPELASAEPSASPVDPAVRETPQLAEPEVIAPVQEQPVRGDRPIGQTEPIFSRRPARKPLWERLSEPEVLAKVGLEALKAVLLAVVSIFVGRGVISWMMSFMPPGMGEVLGVAVFALFIILAWKALEGIRLPN